MEKTQSTSPAKKKSSKTNSFKKQSLIDTSESHKSAIRHKENVTFKRRAEREQKLVTRETKELQLQTEANRSVKRKREEEKQELVLQKVEELQPQIKVSKIVNGSDKDFNLDNREYFSKRNKNSSEKEKSKKTHSLLIGLDQSKIDGVEHDSFTPKNPAQVGFDSIFKNKNMTKNMLENTLENILDHLSFCDILNFTSTSRTMYSFINKWKKIGSTGIENIQPPRNWPTLNPYKVYQLYVDFDDISYSPKNIPSVPFFRIIQRVTNIPKEYWPYIHKTRIKAIEQSNTELTDKDLEELWKCLKHSRVTEINLQSNKITDKGVDKITKIQINTPLRKVNLKNNNITEKVQKNLQITYPYIKWIF
jgi:hypothetical protein